MEGNYTNHQPVFYNGKWYKSLKQCCEQNNKSYKLIHNRLANAKKAGKQISLENAMSTPSQIKTAYDHNGVPYRSISEMARAYKKTPKLVSIRLANGWSIEEALTIPRNMSLGEHRVRECLIRLQIPFYQDCTIKQIFTECGIQINWKEFASKLSDYLVANDIHWTAARIARLRPDFVLYTDQNHHIIGVIEFDGAQHQVFVEAFFYTIQHFVHAINCDTVKEQLWYYLNIPLLRIRDDQVNQIDELVTNFIKHPEQYLTTHSCLGNDYYNQLEKTKYQLGIA